MATYSKSNGFSLIVLASLCALCTARHGIAQATAYAWVQPVDGVDPVAPQQGLHHINDPDAKFKSLQSAIDSMLWYLIQNYNATDNPSEQGVVVALPGLYGPHGAGSSGDAFPIIMRDRVHVIGVGARRCVIRGTGIPPSFTNVYWPLGPSTIVPTAAEVLVSYKIANPANSLNLNVLAPTPWYDNGCIGNSPNVPEILDGFTFEGGDVQVLFPEDPNYPLEARGRISNCVFDMRHNWPLDAEDTNSPRVSGPFIGIQMSKKATYNALIVGYHESRVLIAHNTFIMARWGRVDGLPDQWLESARNEAVAIIDFGNPSTSTNSDPDCRVRGLSNPCIVANLFRTMPSSNTVKPFAMIGIDQPDTRVMGVINGALGPIQTNAFASSRVGANNGFFYSLPVTSFIVEPLAVNCSADVWNCQISNYGTCGSMTTVPCPAAPIPVPAPGAEIWDGVTGVGIDPAFVGEYLNTDPTATGVRIDYRDWRLLPGSPMENKGFFPAADELTTEAGLVYKTVEARDQNLDLFRWDGEHWGNPRVVDGSPDIGFDERHLLTVAGSWSNDSTSHHQPGHMQPLILPASLTRQLILPNLAGGVNLTNIGTVLQIYVRGPTEYSAPMTGPGWVFPPMSLATPANLGSLPQYYRTKYIPFDNNVPTGVPQGWVLQLTGAGTGGSFQPLGNVTGQTLNFRRLQLADDECPPSTCSHIYFDMQGVVYTDPLNVLLRSNLEAEYR